MTTPLCSLLFIADKLTKLEMSLCGLWLRFQGPFTNIFFEKYTLRIHSGILIYKVFDSLLSIISSLKLTLIMWTINYIILINLLNS